MLPWAQTADARMKVMRDEHKSGDMAVLVGPPRAGRCAFADAVEAGRAWRRPWPESGTPRRNVAAFRVKGVYVPRTSMTC